jgi:putative serine protease PepD
VAGVSRTHSQGAGGLHHEHARWPRGLWLWIALGALVGGVVGALIAHAFWSAPDVSAVACNATSVANTVVPSVVTIEVGRSAAGASGTGSGEFYRQGGYILTNNHVVENAARGASIEVVLSTGQRVPATLVGRDPLTDLAVIRAPEAQSPQVIALGSSAALAVGQPVVVVGAPLGLSNSVSSGIVSALARTVQVPGGPTSSNALLADAIQTDAAINPGNSGGAMVNCNGQLVGIPSAGAALPGSSGGSIGLGFAIPVDLAATVANQLIETGHVSHASFGLQTVTVTSPISERTGLPEGIYVAAVQPNGPAATAGLRAGDVITAVNGQPATTTDQLVELTITKSAGDTVDLTYVRAGQTHQTKVTLGSQTS